MQEKNAWNKTNQWDEEIEMLHAIVRKTPLVETTKWGGPVYKCGRNWWLQIVFWDLVLQWCFFER